MPRIVAGTAGGRRLATPPGEGTRPTSDRVREALFARLEHLDAVAAARVLDLFAGSGALGLEAVSRGAATALAVESNRRAAQVIRRNAADLALSVTVREERVEALLAGDPPYAVHLVLLDPPYAVPAGQVGALLARLVDGGWLVPEAVVVLERSARSPAPEWPAALCPISEHTYGETRVHLAEYVPGTDGGR